MKSYEIHAVIQGLMSSAASQPFTPDISTSERCLLKLDATYVDRVVRHAMFQGYLQALTDASKALLEKETA